jgi:hypothetical protein
MAQAQPFLWVAQCREGSVHGAHPALYTTTTGGSLLRNEAHNLLPCHAEPKYAWLYTSAPVYFTAYSLIKNTENFIFTCKRPTEYNAWYIQNLVAEKVAGSIPDEATGFF